MGDIIIKGRKLRVSARKWTERRKASTAAKSAGSGCYMYSSVNNKHGLRNVFEIVGVLVVLTVSDV